MAISEQDRAPSVRSEARGRHWVAWVADANGKPLNSVVLVAESQEEAERRARAWAAPATA